MFMKYKILNPIKLFIIFFLIFQSTNTYSQDSKQVQNLTILYTNDFHSAFDPIPAYWLKGSPKLGGAAELSALINKFRKKEKNVFLFDSGDMFTGMISNLTKGGALMEMMRKMHYDAMAIGNHEFDYGSKNFSTQMNKVPFPILGANIYYKGTDHPYSRPYTIIERNGIKIGVIGIIGQDARSVALPSGITNLDFYDPIPVVRKYVKFLKPQVDLIVVLAHQGKTGPMQTDAEARPELQRNFDEDIKLTTEVKGINVFIGGHAHRGIEKPYVNKKTGTIILQTYGYGTRLGYLKLKIKDNKIVSFNGRLIKVWSDKIKPDTVIAKMLSSYKKEFAPKIGIVVGNLKTRLVREYNLESPLGDFVADVMLTSTGAQVAFENAGGLRADLPEGNVTNGDVLNALPFFNTLVTSMLSGKQIKKILEQGFTLERGMIQVAGIKAKYNLDKPIGNRLVELLIDNQPVKDNKLYKVATNNFLGQGGDLYLTFLKSKQIDTGKSLSDMVIDYLKKAKVVNAPKKGRLIPVKLNSEKSTHTF